MHIELTNVLKFPVNCPSANAITQQLVFKNPEVDNIVKYARNPQWALMGVDPFVKYYDVDNTTQQLVVPIGYKNQLFHHCTMCPYQCPVYDNRTLGERPDERREWTTQLKLRPSQERAMEAVQNTIGLGGTGILKMPTGCGKTVTGFIISHMSRQNTLFVTYTKDLANQTADSYYRFFGSEPGFIGDGKCVIDSHFTVAIIDTIFKRELYSLINENFGLIIVDEVHKVPSSKSLPLMNRTTCKYKVGLTATLNRSDGKEEFIKNTFGGVVYQVTIEEAMVEGSLVPLYAETLETDFEPSQNYSDSKRAVNLLTEEASMNKRRNEKIAECIDLKIREGRSSILVLNSLAQCELLNEMLKDCPGINAAIFTGKQSKKERRDIVDDAREGKVNALLSVQLAGIGLDIPRADHLLMDRKISDPLSVEQIVGRVVRACPQINKTHALVTDVYDKNCEPFRRQSTKRAAVYHKFRPKAGVVQ